MIMSVDKRRRVLATAAMRLMAACVGAAFFFAGAPSRAEDKPKPYIDIRIDDVLPGSIKTFRWNGRPFVIVRATNEMLDDLRAQTPHTWSKRAISDDGPAFFVFSTVSSARGCPVVHAPLGATRYAPKRLWQGGFYDPCRFGEWDYAGRTIKQYVDQDDTMRRPDLDVLAFELKDHSTLRITR
jgi:ubiquinol-cytochrome c reductase iron-sulfur subunit